MLSRVKGFVSRHKRKFIVTGVVVGGTVLALRYAQKKLQEFQEKQAREFIERTRRMQHFDSTERTCNQAIIGLSTNLCDEIIKILSTDQILEQLRTNPENKIQLWEELRVICFSRLTAFIYASSMMVVTLRVQLNLLGGYLYKDTLTTDEGTKISDQTRQEYLSLTQNFLTDGLHKLIKLIKEKVAEVMKTYTLVQKLTLPDIENIFWSIQMALNSDREDPNSKIALYVFPNSMDTQLNVEERSTGILQKMFMETLDLLESDDISVLCSNNISRGFSIAVDHIAEHYSIVAGKMNGVTMNVGDDTVMDKSQLNESSAINHDRPSSSRSITTKEFLNNPVTCTDIERSIPSTTPVININKIGIPLAKLIPIINGLTSKTFNSSVKPQNLATSLITFYLVSEKIKTLGANVYEVFSV